MFCVFQVTIEDKSEKLEVVAAVSDSDCASESPTVAGTVIKNRDPRVPTFGERIIVDRETSGILQSLYNAILGAHRIGLCYKWFVLQVNCVIKEQFYQAII